MISKLVTKQVILRDQKQKLVNLKEQLLSREIKQNDQELIEEETNGMSM